MKKVTNTVLAGVVGTGIMTLTMLLASSAGIPGMSPPEMLATMMSAPVYLGWAAHFAIGISFAFIYSYWLIFKIMTDNTILKGLFFGVIAFIIGQIMLGAIGSVLPMPPMDGSITLIMVVSLIGHAIFGISVALTVSKFYCASTCQTE